MKASNVADIVRNIDTELKPLTRLAEMDWTPGPIIDTSQMSYAEKLKVWRNGGQGFIQWCEDQVCLAIYEEGSDIPKWVPMSEMSTEVNPETGRSYRDCWEFQKPIFMEALQMRKGRFKHRLIVLCWMRGEGKSLMACLIQLWKFFCFPKQSIMLGANSKDQVKFVHYDIMREIILNSPNLLELVGEKNIQEKEIRLQNSKGNTVSIIRSISSFSGIVSNITGYTFSEIFDMKNPKFFVQLDGSIRNMPNALGVIDSTVSSKTHILYKLYQSSLEKSASSLTFFSYRCSKTASYKDFFNPMMTQTQLDDYMMKFPPIEFDRYFRNTWESGVGKIFTEEMVEAMYILSVHPNGLVIPGTNMIQTFIKNMKALQEDPNPRDSGQNYADMQRRVVKMSSVYKVSRSSIFHDCATIDDLKRLSDIYDTDWAIGVGADRADPLKITTRGARTIVSCVAKGLMRSRSNPGEVYDIKAINSYIYINLGLFHIQDSSLKGIKEVINICQDTYDGIDRFTAERWGMFDIVSFLEDQEISYELISPSNEKQRMAFSEMFMIVSGERFKTTTCGVAGFKMDDLFKEEALVFEQNEEEGTKLWYGSPEKGERYGIQDDSIYATTWNIYGMREITALEFRERGNTQFMGAYIPNKELKGTYSR